MLYKKRLIAFTLVLVSLFIMVVPASAATTSLQYSVLHSTPSGFQNYNCYGYAIGTYQNVNPGYYSGRSYSCTTTAIRDNVMADLRALGYTNVRTVSSTYSLQPGEFMVAFACGFWYQIASTRALGTSKNVTPMAEGYNYHFWKKNTDGGYWYHKMGRISSIMRLKSGYTPSTIVVNDEMHNGTTGNYSSAGYYLPSANVIYIVYSSETSVNSINSP